MGVGQYNSLGEYCGPHTASSVFLILILVVSRLGNSLVDSFTLATHFKHPGEKNTNYMWRGPSPMDHKINGPFHQVLCTYFYIKVLCT